MAKSRFSMVVLLVVSGCAADLRMRPTTTPATASASDAAVVFIRPGRELPTYPLELRDHDGRWLGRLGTETRTSVRVTPGQHFFVAQVVGRHLTRPTALFAELEAGRTYYVEIGIYDGFPALWGVSPRLAERGELGRWLEHTTELEPDPAAGTPPEAGEWNRMLAYLVPWFTALPIQVAAERSVLADDGVSSAVPSTPGEPIRSRPLVAMLAEAENATPAEVLTDAEVPRCVKEPPVGSHVLTIKCVNDRQLFAHQLAVQDLFRKAKLSR